MTSCRTSASISWMRCDVEVGAFADGVGGIFRDHAGLGEGFGGGDFDGQPGAEAIFVAPDAAHLRAGIAWDHGCVTS